MKTPSLVALALLAAACNDATGPTSEVRTSLVAGMNPAQSGVVTLSPQGQLFPRVGLILPGTNLVQVDVTTTLARAEPYAQLDLYLLTADGNYCGQNTPDAPEFRNLPAGWTERRTVSGFDVYRLPCQVTGVRAILHRRPRSTGLLFPPSADQIIVEATAPAQLLLRAE
ncbi:MAG: hypothetical protein ABW221_19265 [Vicinamibacteria bacterium]